MAISTILDNQSVHFDNHSRGKDHNGVKNLHFHKTKKNKKAEISIYVDGSAKWECINKNLENEVRNALKSMSVIEKIKFVYEAGESVDQFYSGKPLTNELKTEIRDNIITAFFPEEKDKVISKSTPFKKIFLTDYSDVTVKINNRTYRVSYTGHSGQKKIKITDITKLK